MKEFIKKNWLIIVTGIVVGIAALLLQALGNPKNMGFCIACFERDIAGALKLHSAEVVQYARPEIIGIVLGACIMAIAGKEFRVHAGSSPATRFVLGAFVMIGALVFLGCPLRMLIRMGGGDLNAFVGLIGFIVGAAIGTIFLRKGFNLGRAYQVTKSEGFVLPVLMIGLLILSIGVPGLLNSSESGPGSMRAPMLVALGCGLVVGALAQRSRLCMAGGIRDTIMLKDPHLLWGSVAIFVVVLLGNIILGKFNGFSALSQPIAHSNQLWNLLGMVIVGWGSVLLGGCPLRQLVLAGSGNGDSAVTVFGMITGAAFAHNFGLASGADKVDEAGNYVKFAINTKAKVAVAIALVVLLVISICNVAKQKKAGE